MQRPKPTSGLRHVALYIKNFETTIQFYTDLVGMNIEWQPDADNVYLTSGNDNLALHRAANDFEPSLHQHLDHIGFILDEPDQVDCWFEYLNQHHVPMLSKPKNHRDGARSFYCQDPEGNNIQFIFHPPIAKKLCD